MEQGSAYGASRLTKTRNHAEQTMSPTPEVDLHGMPPDQALRRLTQALHAARVQGAGRLRVITGRGWGNREQKPVLRSKIETWARSPEGARAGVTGIRVVSKGGALDLTLG